MASQCIISAYRNNKNRKEKEEGNVVPLWKNLEVIGGKHYRPHNNIIYYCVYMFRNTLTFLMLLSFKPNMKFMEYQAEQLEGDVSLAERNDEEFSEGNQDDTSRYIESFKHIKELSLMFGDSDSIYVLEKYLGYCSTDLKSLSITWWYGKSHDIETAAGPEGIDHSLVVANPLQEFSNVIGPLALFTSRLLC